MGYVVHIELPGRRGGGIDGTSNCSESRSGCATVDNALQYALETKGMEMIQDRYYSVGIECSNSPLEVRRFMHGDDVLDNSICNKSDSRREFAGRRESEYRKTGLIFLALFCLYLAMARVSVGMHESSVRGLSCDMETRLCFYGFSSFKFRLHFYFSQFLPFFLFLHYNRNNHNHNHKRHVHVHNTLATRILKL